MKKLYSEFFAIPDKGGKIREKVLFTRVAVSVILILACLGAMSFTAYAYFTSNVTSNITDLESAKYELAITTVGEISTSGEYYVLDNTDGTEAKTFEFTLTKGGTASVGYCKIEVITDVSGTQIFYTKPIGSYIEASNSVTVNERTVKINVLPYKTAQVKFTSEWGSCTQTPIVDENVEPQYGTVGNTPNNLLGQSTPQSNSKASTNNTSGETNGTTQQNTPTASNTTLSNTAEESSEVTDNDDTLSDDETQPNELSDVAGRE